MVPYVGDNISKETVLDLQGRETCCLHLMDETSPKFRMNLPPPSSDYMVSWLRRPYLNFYLSENLNSHKVGCSGQGARGTLNSPVLVILWSQSHHRLAVGKWPRLQRGPPAALCSQMFTFNWRPQRPSASLTLKNGEILQTSSYVPHYWVTPTYIISQFLRTHGKGSFISHVRHSQAFIWNFLHWCFCAHLGGPGFDSSHGG